MRSTFGNYVLSNTKRYTEEQLSNPLFKVETCIANCHHTEDIEIESRVREHIKQIDDFIELEMFKKGFVRLKKEEFICVWRKCPLCEIGSKEPHLCYDGQLPVPVER